MRKKTILCLLFLLLFTVGCKSKELTCTKDVFDTDEVKLTEWVSLTFKGNRLTNSSLGQDYIDKTNNEKNIENRREVLEEEFAIYEDKKGTEFILRDMEGGLQYELQVDISKIDDETKEELSLITNYKNYQDAKSQLVNQGYSCK